jgi:hypothetical protein
MKKAIWLIVGVGIGFVAAHQASKTDQGKRFFDDIDAKTKEFRSAVNDGYRKREAELRSTLGDARSSLADRVTK